MECFRLSTLVQLEKADIEYIKNSIDFNDKVGRRNAFIESNLDKFKSVEYAKRHITKEGNSFYVDFADKPVKVKNYKLLILKKCRFLINYFYENYYDEKRSKIKCMCACGGIFTACSKNGHERSQRHIKYLQTQN